MDSRARASTELPTEFTLELEPIAARRGDPFRSRMIVDGEDTGTVVCGIAFEAALAMDRGWLVFNSYDCPHEELLEIYLFDERWKVLDHLTLGMPYVSGVLCDLRRVTGNEACFRFFGEDEWCVVIEAPRWRLHPWASTMAHLWGPIARPLSRIVNRGMLRLEGEYEAQGGRRLRLRS